MYEYNNTDNSQRNDSQTVVNPVATKEQQKKQKKAAKKAARRKVWKKIGVAAIVGLTFGITAGGAFMCINVVADRFLPSKQPQAQVETQENNEKNDEDVNTAMVEDKEADSSEADFSNGDIKLTTTASKGMDVSEIAKSAMPAVVSITNKSVQQVRSMFGMGIQEYENTSVGSGIIIGKNDDELLLVTNNHVIEGAKTLTVGFVDDEVYEAYTKGTDADRDLAVIAVKLSDISDDTLNAISIATLGDSSDLEVGEQVVAIGNALGYGQSVTTGIISALDREVTIENVTNNLIQTDAAINPGNSGGALLNMAGELIGINSAKFASSSVEGMGYAIPIDTVKPIVEELMNRATREQLDAADAGYLGITGLNVDTSVSSAYGIPVGVYLQEITSGSPAEDAGLIKGDVITKFDGTSVKTISELKDMLLYYKPGEKVKVVFYRADDGEYAQKTVEVTLGDRKGTALDPENESKEDKSENESGDSGVNEGNVEQQPSDNNGSQFEFNPFFGIFGY